MMRSTDSAALDSPNPRVAAVAAVAAGLAAAIVAGAGTPAVLVAVGVLVAPIAVLAPPGLFVVALLFVVVLQDFVVDAGVTAIRYADEALVLAGLASLATARFGDGRRDAAGPTPGVAPTSRITMPKPVASTSDIAPTAQISVPPPVASTSDIVSTSWIASQPRVAPPSHVAPTWPASSRPFLLTPLDLPLAILSAVMLASAIAAGVPLTVAGLGMLALLKGPLAFQLAARAPLARGTCLKVAEGLAILVAAVALVGVAQRLGGESVFMLTGRAAYFETWQGLKAPGLLSHHNALGHAAVLGGGLSLALSRAAEASGRRRAARRLRLAAACCLAGLLASASRESWIAAGGAAVATALVARSWRALGAAVALAGALAALGGLSYFASPDLRAEMERRVAGVAAGWHDYALGFTGWEYRGEYRIYAALKSAEIAADRPLLGVGPGRYGGAVAERFGSSVYDDYRVLPLDGVHSPLDIFWARLPAEIGLLGAAAYVLAFLSAVAPCARIVRAGSPDPLDLAPSSDHGGPFRAGLSDPLDLAPSGDRRGTLRAGSSSDPFLRALAAGGFAAAIAATVFAAFSPALEDPLVAIPVYVWAGIVWRLGEGADRGREPGEPEDLRRGAGRRE